MRASRGEREVGPRRRASLALGYSRLITYILDSESGTSLKAAGWHFLSLTGGGDWTRPSRPRFGVHPQQQKQLWDAVARPHGDPRFGNMELDSTRSGTRSGRRL